MRPSCPFDRFLLNSHCHRRRTVKFSTHIFKCSQPVSSTRDNEWKSTLAPPDFSSLSFFVGFRVYAFYATRRISLFSSSFSISLSYVCACLFVCIFSRSLLLEKPTTTFILYGKKSNSIELSSTDDIFSRGSLRHSCQLRQWKSWKESIMSHSGTVLSSSSIRQYESQIEKLIDEKLRDCLEHALFFYACQTKFHYPLRDERWRKFLK